MIIETAFDSLKISEGELEPEDTFTEVSQQSNFKLRHQLLNNYDMFLYEILNRCGVNPNLLHSKMIIDQHKVGYRKANDGDIKK